LYLPERNDGNQNQENIHNQVQGATPLGVADGIASLIKPYIRAYNGLK
jgi:hypothetical protein